MKSTIAIKTRKVLIYQTRNHRQVIAVRISFMVNVNARSVQRNPEPKKIVLHEARMPNFAILALIESGGHPKWSSCHGLYSEPPLGIETPSPPTHPPALFARLR
jgi:hypothetical protein